MKTKEIELSADDLVGSVEAFAHHLMGKTKLSADKQSETTHPHYPVN